VTAPSVEPLLTLNDPELEWKRFERFCLDLVIALPEVRDAHLYGTRGEDQQGIDIHADLVDGAAVCERCGAEGALSRTVAQWPWYAVRCDGCREDGWILASGGR